MKTLRGPDGKERPRDRAVMSQAADDNWAATTAVARFNQPTVSSHLRQSPPISRLLGRLSCAYPSSPGGVCRPLSTL